MAASGGSAPCRQVQRKAVVVACQHLPQVVAGTPRARQRTAQVIAHDLRGATEPAIVGAVPQGQQHVAVTGDIQAREQVLAIAQGPGWRNGSRPSDGNGNGTTSACPSRRSNCSRDCAVAKSCAYNSTGNGSGTIRRAPSSSPTSATSRSPPSASGDSTISSSSGNWLRSSLIAARTCRVSSGICAGSRSRWLVTPTTSAVAGECSSRSSAIAVPASLQRWMTSQLAPDSAPSLLIDDLRIPCKRRHPWLVKPECVKKTAPCLDCCQSS